MAALEIIGIVSLLGALLYGTFTGRVKVHCACSSPSLARAYGPGSEPFTPTPVTQTPDAAAPAGDLADQGQRTSL